MKKGKRRLKQNNIIPVDKYVSFLMKTDNLTAQQVKCLRFVVREYIAVCKQHKLDIMNGPLC